MQRARPLRPKAGSDRAGNDCGAHQLVPLVWRPGTQSSAGLCTLCCRSCKSQDWQRARGENKQMAEAQKRENEGRKYPGKKKLLSMPFRAAGLRQEVRPN